VLRTRAQKKAGAPPLSRLIAAVVRRSEADGIDDPDAALSEASTMPVAGVTADAPHLTRGGVGLAGDADTIVKDAHGAAIIANDGSTSGTHQWTHFSGGIFAAGNNIVTRVNELRDAIQDAEKDQTTVAVGRAADSGGTA